ncbi:MAG: hypothetical protein D6696_04735 [Acidobacteria bacterium]|nr:MAG: hypothetical protein D6696_04735 [Acidobacteriota bacterium]
MKTVRNKTPLPLRVPLPQKKVLHLGPHKTGQISVHDVDHPPLVKLVEAGKIEILGDGEIHAAPTPNPEAAHASTHGYHPDAPLPRRGDRGT